MTPKAEENAFIKSFQPKFLTEWWEETDLHFRAKMTDGDLWGVYWDDNDPDDKNYCEMWAHLWDGGNNIWFVEGTREEVEKAVKERYAPAPLIQFNHAKSDYTSPAYLARVASAEAEIKSLKEHRRTRPERMKVRTSLPR